MELITSIKNIFKCQINPKMSVLISLSPLFLLLLLRVLLALVVALLNASSGLQALYVFLTAVAFSLFLFFAVRPLYKILCIRTGSMEHGPTPLLMTVTFVIVLISAFVTDIIGVHPIFGGFLAGTIIPHENDLAIKVAEKTEDLVNILLLPLVRFFFFFQFFSAVVSLFPCNINLNFILFFFYNLGILVFYTVWFKNANRIVKQWTCLGLCHFGHLFGMFW